MNNTSHNLSDLDSLIRNTVSDQSKTVTVKNTKKGFRIITQSAPSIKHTPDELREKFTKEIAVYCTPEEFDLIGIELLMDQDFYNGFVLRVEQKANKENMKYFFRKEIADITKIKADQIVTSNVTPLFESIQINSTEMKEEIVMNQPEQTLPINMYEPRVNADQEISTDAFTVQIEETRTAATQLNQAAEKLEETVARTASSEIKAAQEEGINWGSVAKTVGVASLGAAVGAAGMWAFRKFFG